MRRLMLGLIIGVLIGAPITYAAASGLPHGWTQDNSNPANVFSNNGALNLGSGSLNADVAIVDQVAARTLVAAPTHVINLPGALNNVAITGGNADPSQPPGIDQTPGALYMRNIANTSGQLWLKLGSNPTDWRQVALAP